MTTAGMHVFLAYCIGEVTWSGHDVTSLAKLALWIRQSRAMPRVCATLGNGGMHNACSVLMNITLNWTLSLILFHGQSNSVGGKGKCRKNIIRST